MGTFYDDHYLLGISCSPCEDHLSSNLSSVAVTGVCSPAPHKMVSQVHILSGGAGLPLREVSQEEEQHPDEMANALSGRGRCCMRKAYQMANAVIWSTGSHFKRNNNAMG